jgi:hypothetical protein
MFFLPDFRRFPVFCNFTNDCLSSYYFYSSCAGMLKIRLKKHYQCFYLLPSGELCKKIDMEVITIDSQAYKELMAKINTIARFVTAINTKIEEQPEEEGWVDSYEVCTFLKISSRTLQRLRTEGAINFSRIRGKNYYRISELQRLLQNSIIRRSDEHLQDLIKNHQFYVEQRRNIKKDK